MASLVLGAAGSALGGSLLGSGLFGGLLTGAQIGGALGSLAGLEIDAALMPGRTVTRSGARLSDIAIQASTEGTAIPRLFGRMRLAGQLIWASRFKETASTSSTSRGGKGGAGVTTVETDYSYSISFAVGLCEGVGTRLGRVWANGSLLDVSQYTLRFHGGADDQPVDPLIAAIDGDVPAFRGLCHVVLEDMPLAAFGNRIPQLQFEVWRSLETADSLENRLTGVALIPGAGEFVYAGDAVFADDGNGGSTALNMHGAAPDMETSLDDLTALAPNMDAVSLVVGWFGDDLRAGHITVRPGVEDAVKDTYPLTWRVNGAARADAHLVSRRDGRPAYGGTPSDDSVVQAIQALNARGLKVMFNPFLFMDIAADNTLVDPQTGVAGQSPYPWRGRIRPLADDDRTGAAATQVAQFFGAASVSDFAISGTAVEWTGGDDWGWRRMVLHYAHLCAAAGGVEAFLIGSELRGLTRTRSSDVAYPAVTALKALAADVRAILADTRIGYAADWSEYNNHQLGAGAVLFNLDPLWSDDNIDFIGLDNYLPLSDWRDGAQLDDAASVYDPAYLAANIRGGEDYDWYYAGDADRAAQIRTPITDGLGKPWVWRAKDLWNWWSNPHHDRPDGSEGADATTWVPGSKPIRFTELGCPAINKGAGQPNVFFDPKSGESAVPYFSSGARDDLMQRRFLEAHLNFWRDLANNPGMVTGIYVWCWDARPFPAFPARSDVWSDAGNYAFGHWLNGRLGAVALPNLVAAICNDAGFTQYDVSGLDGLVTGYAITDGASARDALQPLAVACFFDAVESQGMLRFAMRGRGGAFAFDSDGLVLKDHETAGFNLVRAQESDLPQVSRITYIDGDQDYRQASVEARRLAGGSNRVASSGLALVMDQEQAAGIGARLLQDAWVMRESATFTLPPSVLALDACDEVLLTAGGREHRLRVTQIDDAAGRAVEAVATDPSLYEAFSGPVRAPAMAQTLAQSGRVTMEFLDLPLLGSEAKAWVPYAAAFASPWPGSVPLLRSAGDANYQADTVLTQPAIMGVTTDAFFAGPLWRWDTVNALKLRLYDGTLSSLDDASVLGGANAIAVKNADGAWEVLQFAHAELTVPNEYTLTRLLRGQAGTEGAMGAPAGARVVVLNEALQQLGLDQAQARLTFNYRWGPAGKPMSDATWQGRALQFDAVGLKPFAPFHVRVQRLTGGDMAISWRRRDRSPAALGWNNAATPMSETGEAYDLDIMDSGAVIRSFASVTQASLTYTAAQQVADFPAGLPSPLVVRVCQLSSVLGRGHVKEEHLYV